MDKIGKSVNIFKALGDLTRLRIVEAIFEDGLSVGDIAKKLNMTQSAISHQLKTLKDNDIVRCVRKGKEVHYYLSDEHVRQIVAQVFDHTSHN
jgi:ArsR family transcriptional regulator